MNEGLIPTRYAKALYMVACEKGVDARMYQMMKTLEAGFAAQPSLQGVLANPFVSDADKTRLLLTAANAGEGDAVYDDFLKLLSHNHRMDMARGIALAYVAIYRKANHIYEVRVVSAAPMSQAEQSRLQDMIRKHLGGGTMEYFSSVDPSLIGGFTVSVGNERIDASISNELKQLRLNLINN